MFAKCDTMEEKISIHALREEGDRVQPDKKERLVTFQSTPSARRATCPARGSCRRMHHFNPRPPRGGRLRVCHRF